MTAGTSWALILNTSKIISVHSQDYIFSGVTISSTQTDHCSSQSESLQDAFNDRKRRLITSEKKNPNHVAASHLQSTYNHWYYYVFQMWADTKIHFLTWNTQQAGALHCRPCHLCTVQGNVLKTVIKITVFSGFMWLIVFITWNCISS